MTRALPRLGPTCHRFVNPILHINWAHSAHQVDPLCAVKSHLIDDSPKNVLPLPRDLAQHISIRECSWTDKDSDMGRRCRFCIVLQKPCMQASLLTANLLAALQLQNLLLWHEIGP